MKSLVHAIVAVVVCVAAAVSFASAGEIHAMAAADAARAPEALELSVAGALTAGHKAWSAVDFWLQ